MTVMTRHLLSSVIAIIQTSGKDLWNGWVLSLEWKTEGVIDGESEDGDCDEVICAQDAVNQEESEQNEVDGMKKRADSTSNMMHI